MRCSRVQIEQKSKEPHGQNHMRRKNDIRGTDLMGQVLTSLREEW